MLYTIFASCWCPFVYVKNVKTHANGKNTKHPTIELLPTSLSHPCCEIIWAWCRESVFFYYLSYCCTSANFGGVVHNLFIFRSRNHLRQIKIDLFITTTCPQALNSLSTHACMMHAMQILLNNESLVALCQHIENNKTTLQTCCCTYHICHLISSFGPQPERPSPECRWLRVSADPCSHPTLQRTRER